MIQWIPVAGSCGQIAVGIAMRVAWFWLACGKGCLEGCIQAALGLRSCRVAVRGALRLHWADPALG